MVTYEITIDTSKGYRVARTSSDINAARIVTNNVNTGMHCEGILDIIRDGESVRFSSNMSSDVVTVEITH